MFTETYICYAWKAQDIADDWKLPQEVEDHWEEVSVEPKQGKTVSLNSLATAL